MAAWVSGPARTAEGSLPEGDFPEDRVYQTNIRSVSLYQSQSKSPTLYCT